MPAASDPLQLYSANMSHGGYPNSGGIGRTGAPGGRKAPIHRQPMHAPPLSSGLLRQRPEPGPMQRRMLTARGARLAVFDDDGPTLVAGSEGAPDAVLQCPGASAPLRDLDLVR